MSSSVLNPSWAGSAVLSVGVVLLAKRLVDAMIASRSRSVALELSRHQSLISELAIRRYGM
ncbi:hypothetical protein [Microvirga flavescens]|uniref:hypothetical protein n=1 Tax=Microvirga flavescens TaxID=2249811 RepID=UPI000DD6892C|nr:hypothetical protein [Microvirga flavescens]